MPSMRTIVDYVLRRRERKRPRQSWSLWLDHTHSLQFIGMIDRDRRVLVKE